LERPGDPLNAQSNRNFAGRGSYFDSGQIRVGFAHHELTRRLIRPRQDDLLEDEVRQAATDVQHGNGRARQDQAPLQPSLLQHYLIS
jgi:hypothetical protein